MRSSTSKVDVSIFIVTIGAAVPPPSLGINVSIESPASNYAIRITGVYHVSDEIWAVSQVRTEGDFGASVITTITDSVQIADGNVPKNADGAALPIKHKVLGKTWNWGKNTADIEYVPQKGEDRLRTTLIKAKKVPVEGR